MIIRAFEHCKRCPDLCSRRKKIVWGVDMFEHDCRPDIHAYPPYDICFVGESPSEAEELIGRPFVGPSGKILRSLMNDATERTGLNPTYYLTSVVLCRCHDGFKPRQPTKDEIINCQPRLVAEIQKVKPRVIIPLGKVADMNTKSLSAQMSIHRQPLPHPNYIARLGGTNSALYRSTMRDLAEIYKWLAT